ncbi:hypothetical protein D922_04080 [Enterococcus faecalis 06-MB-DW-09]|nr:hypothetical protein D922_04080 [Enterococcus faecalis 06-MB-DW-09]
MVIGGITILSFGAESGVLMGSYKRRNQLPDLSRQSEFFGQ